MSQVGVTVAATEVPQATLIPYNTANAFIVGVADFGPTTATQVTSLPQFANTFGTPSGSGNPYSSRTATNATLFDAVDTFFREGGTSAYIGRVLGAASNASATLTLAPSAALTLTAQYQGVGGNAINVAVANTGGTSVVFTLTDASGNTLAVSPSLTTLAACVNWFASTGLVTAVSSGSTLPSTVSATPLTGGSNGTTPGLTQYTNALNQFSATLGPGQVLAPGVTNTTISGIWSALGTHAQNNNRIALCDMDDNTSAATAVTAIGTFGTTAVASYCGFWSGNLNIPGTTPGTTRSISPSPVIAALCARVDNQSNPNVAAAGSKFPLKYAIAPTSIVTGSGSTYSPTDLATLNSAGINTWQLKFGVFENYGFVSAVPPTTDAIYWQLNHSRLRMTLVAQGQLLGEPFLFSQIDGKGSQAIAFAGVLNKMLSGFYSQGALYGATPADAFNVDTGSDVNTPSTISAGQLNATVQVRMSPFAQLVQITINVVPITQVVT